MSTPENASRSPLNRSEKPPNRSSSVSVDELWTQWVREDPELTTTVARIADGQNRVGAFLRMLATYRNVLRSRSLLRNEKKFTQKWVADRMGTSQARVAMLEKGDQDIKVSTLVRYAASLGCRFDVRAVDDAGSIVAWSGPAELSADLSSELARSSDRHTTSEFPSMRVRFDKTVRTRSVVFGPSIRVASAKEGALPHKERRPAPQMG